MIFETILECPTADRYEQHLFLDDLMGEPMEDGMRHWLWRSLGGNMIALRSSAPVGKFNWQPVPIPESGTKARILLEAHVRQNRHTFWGKKIRPSRDDDDDLGKLHWFRNRGAECGFDVQALNMQSDVVWISKRSKPFGMRIVVYMGVVTITDPASVEHFLLRGLGNAKAYGCGFMILSPIGGSENGKQRRQATSSVRVSESRAEDTVRGVPARPKRRATRSVDR